MKRIVALTVVVMFSACTQIGNGIVQEGTLKPDPVVNPQPDPVVNPPDPVIIPPINSRFVGRVESTISGEAKDFDAILEFQEKQAGKLVGYGQLRDRLANNALFLDYWQEGQRNDADVTINLRISDESCVNIKIKGKLDMNGDITVPKTDQSICGFSKMTTEAFVLKREGEANKFNWKAIETHFAPK
jgi:hypothetical protein